jgi:hypothetical protein
MDNAVFLILHTWELIDIVWKLGLGIILILFLYWIVTW